MPQDPPVKHTSSGTVSTGGGGLLPLMVRLSSRRQQEALRIASALRPHLVDGSNSLPDAPAERSKVSQLTDLYLRALGVARGSRETLGIAYQGLGELEKAAQIYRAWLEEEPDNPIARHHLAACTGAGVPARAADQYVQITFDRFAETFDAKLGELRYRGPECIAEAIASVYGRPAKQLEVLDAGCGTGLCGAVVAGYARYLVGVDLSGEMLARARRRGVYDEVHTGELTAFLAGAQERYDLVISGDTLCYFGELTEVAVTAWGALRPAGCFAFTVEALDDDALAGAGYRIGGQGRYAHAHAYLEATFIAAGFVDLRARAVQLRLDGGRPVNGLVVTCRKPGSTSP